MRSPIVAQHPPGCIDSASAEGSIGQTDSLNALKLEKLCRARRRNRHGAAAVEFALVAPLFFFLVFGMIEVGRAIMVQQVLTNASREGARFAALGTTTVKADVDKVVNDYLAGSGIPTVTPVIKESQWNSVGYTGPVTVTVSVPFGSVSWLPMPKIGFNVAGKPVTIDLKSKTLSATTVMRKEETVN